MRYYETIGRILILLVCGLTIAGCITPGQPAVTPDLPSPAELKSDGTERWWRIRLVFDWPENSAPAWHLDLLAAHRAAAPALKAHHARIPLWRFHRRAFRDKAGHQFSLILYTDRETAGKVFDAIQAAPEVGDLQSSGKLRGAYLDPAGANGGHQVEDTSDPHWSAELKKAWPWFIMGVSRTWLALADEQAAAIGKSLPATLAGWIEYYKELNAKVTAVWRREGSHALLHHLNALFGYEPLVIREERLIRF